MAERAERCEACRFYDPDDTDSSHETGWCHRYAPRASTSTDDTQKPIDWPKVYMNDWCGEFEPLGGAVASHPPL